MDTTIATGPEQLTSTTVRRLAEQRLSPHPSALIFDPRSDHVLHIGQLAKNPALAAEHFSDRPLRDAAVLVPIVERQSPTVLLTQRPTHMPSHAGQIAFPGGKLEPGDADAVAAAFREAREEIGLAAEFIETIGFLDSVRTRTGYHITPVVALVRPGFTLDLDYREVEEAFEVPLAFLMNPDNHRREIIVHREQTRHVYAVPFARRYIWGITAGIIRNMHNRLFANPWDGRQ